MLWEIEILPKLRDAETERVRQELALLTHGRGDRPAIALSSRGYLMEGGFPESQGVPVRDRASLLRTYVDVATLRDVIVGEDGKIAASPGRHDERMILLGRYGVRRLTLTVPAPRRAEPEFRPFEKKLEELMGRGPRRMPDQGPVPFSMPRP